MKKSIFLVAFALMTFCGQANAQQVKTFGAQLKGEEVVSTLAKDYAGKVTLVDFWATWCPPCRAAMKTIDPIKEKWMKKGVEFVYVTGETSPEATWKTMLKTIKGDHYRLTKTQWESLLKKLSMRGIPAYMIIGKDGSVVYSNVTEGGYPGNEVIEEELQKAVDAQ